MADATRNVIVNVSIKLAEQKLPAPDTTEFRREIQSLQDTTVGAINNIVESFGRIKTPDVDGVEIPLKFTPPESADIPDVSPLEIQTVLESPETSALESVLGDIPSTFTIAADLTPPTVAEVTSALESIPDTVVTTTDVVPPDITEVTSALESIPDTVTTSIDADAPNLTDAKAALDDYETKAADTATGVAEAFDRMADSAKKLGDKTDDAGQKSEELATKVHDNALRAGEGFKTAGEGAFTLARGIAFVGASSEEEFQKALRVVARFQGAFDIFKGGVDAIKGLTEGTRALRTATAATTTATTAAATAETGLAAANTAVATSGAAASASMQTLLISLGPIALAAGGVAAAFAFLGDTPDEVDALEDSFGRLNDTLTETEKFRLQLSGLEEEVTLAQRLNQLELNRAQLAEGRFSTERRLREQQKAAGEEQRQVFRSIRESLAGDIRIISVEEALKLFPAEQFGREFSESLSRQIKTAEDALEVATALRKAIADDAALQAAVREDPALVALLESEAKLLQTQLDISQAALSLEEEHNRKQEEKTRIIREQEEARQKSLETANRELETARKAEDAERARLQTTKERFGALSAEEARQIKAIGERAQRGEQITEEQARKLEPFAPEIAAASRSERADRFGFDQFLAGLQDAVGRSQNIVDVSRENLPETRAAETATEQVAAAEAKVNQLLPERLAPEPPEQPAVPQAQTPPSVSVPLQRADQFPAPTDNGLAEALRRRADEDRRIQEDIAATVREWTATSRDLGEDTVSAMRAALADASENREQIRNMRRELEIAANQVR